MATATITRPGHRRQASGDGPVGNGSQLITPQLIDGRVLGVEGEAAGAKQSVAQRRFSKADDSGPATSKAGPTKSRPSVLGRAADKPPMTPPRVSGISLAPLPDPDHHGGDRAAAGKLGARVSQTHMNIGGKAPPPPGAGTGAGAAGVPSAAAVAAAAAASSAAASSGPQQLIAEGRSFQRGTIALDPRLIAFHEINGGDGDSDSVCSTPLLNVDQLTRHEGYGAFGPLTPHPLSPSILTLCGRPGLDDQFEFAGAAEATGELVDMRTCNSPRLPSS